MDKSIRKRTPTLQELEAIDGGPIQPYDERFLVNKPIQRRAFITLQRIVDATEVALADPAIGREKISYIHIINQTGRDGTGKPITVGVFYRYFNNEICAMNYVWPERRDIFFNPANRPVKPQQ